MSNWNDRSDAALQKRLELAKKATHGPWALWEWDNGVKEIRSNADPDEDHVCRVWHKKDGDFLAKNSPIEVQADIEEILRLRQEVARLNKEADWLAKIMFFYTEECPLKMKIQDELPIPKLDECLGAWPENDYFDCVKNTPKKCWREAARKAVEEEERHE